MREIKLKPCPFCGGEAFIHEICEDFLGVGWKMKGFAVSCKKCHATTEYDKDKNIAIYSWNKRAGEAGEAEGGMTEKEAISELAVYILQIEHSLAEGECEEYSEEERAEARRKDEQTLGVLNMAIKALEEIKQYREIGTVEEIQAAVDQATAKPLTNLGACPKCGRYIGADVRPWCHSCGQRLDWEAKG